MNAVMPMPPRRRSREMGRILAIEADPARARVLQHILQDHIDADLEIVRSADEAIPSITREVPDLVLTSSFLRLSEEAALTAHLKQLPGASHVQVIIVPYFINAEDAPGRGVQGTKVRSFLKRRSVLASLGCDPRTVREQIEEYLGQARVVRLMPADRRSTVGLVPTPAAARDVRLVPKNGG